MILKFKNRAFFLLAVYSLSLFFSLLPNLSFGNVLINKVCKNKKQLVLKRLANSEPTKYFYFDKTTSGEQQSSTESNIEVNSCQTTVVVANNYTEIDIAFNSNRKTFFLSQSYQNPDLKNLVNPPKQS